MTVIRPNSVSGITSITAQANEINVFRSNGLLAGLNLNGVNFNTTAGISTLAALKVTGNLDVEGVLTYQDVTNVDSLGIGTFRTGINVSGGQLDVGSNIKLGNAGVITATSFVGSGAQLTGITQTTINSNTNNYLITGTGTANTLQGEANLTFNGTTLDLNGTANILKSDSSGFHVLIRNTNNTNGNQAELRFQGTNSSNGGYTTARIVATNLDNYNQYSDLRFYTHSLGSTTEKLRIRQDGKVVIGTNYTGGTLSVTGNLITDDGTNGRVTIQGDSTSTNQILSTTTGFASYCNMKYQAADHIFLYGGTERMRVKADGRMGINANPSVNHEYLHIKPVGNNVLDLRYELNSDTDIRHKFFDNTGTQRGTFGYTTYANNSSYPNFHDSFYIQTDPGSNGSLATVMWINRDGQFIKPYTYKFLVETSGVSVSGGWTKLTGMSINSTHSTGVSNGTYWSNSNQRFTAPVTGTYNFFIGGFSSTAEGGGTNHRYMYVFVINGGNYHYGIGGSYSDGNTPMEGGSINYKLSVNDYVEVYYFTAISATWGNSSHRFYWGGYFLG